MSLGRRERPRRESSRGRESPGRFRENSRRWRSPVRRRDSPERPRRDRRDRSGSYRNEDRHESTQIQEITQSMAEVMREVGVKKLEPPPTWYEEVSLEGWIRSVEVWARNNAQPAEDTSSVGGIEKLKERWSQRYGYC